MGLGRSEIVIIHPDDMVGNMIWLAIDQKKYNLQQSFIFDSTAVTRGTPSQHLPLCLVPPRGSSGPLPVEPLDGEILSVFFSWENINQHRTIIPKTKLFVGNKWDIPYKLLMKVGMEKPSGGFSIVMVHSRNISG